MSSQTQPIPDEISARTTPWLAITELLNYLLRLHGRSSSATEDVIGRLHKARQECERDLRFFFGFGTRAFGSPIQEDGAVLTLSRYSDVFGSLVEELETLLSLKAPIPHESLVVTQTTVRLMTLSALRFMSPNTGKAANARNWWRAVSRYETERVVPIIHCLNEFETPHVAPFRVNRKDGEYLSEFDRTLCEDIIAARKSGKSTDMAVFLSAWQKRRPSHAEPRAPSPEAAELPTKKLKVSRKPHVSTAPKLIDYDKLTQTGRAPLIAAEMKMPVQSVAPSVAGLGDGLAESSVPTTAAAASSAATARPAGQPSSSSTGRADALPRAKLWDQKAFNRGGAAAAFDESFAKFYRFFPATTLNPIGCVENARELAIERTAREGRPVQPWTALHRRLKSEVDIAASDYADSREGNGVYWNRRVVSIVARTIHGVAAFAGAALKGARSPTNTFLTRRFEGKQVDVWQQASASEKAKLANSLDEIDAELSRVLAEEKPIRKDGLSDELNALIGLVETRCFHNTTLSATVWRWFAAEVDSSPPPRYWIDALQSFSVGVANAVFTASIKQLIERIVPNEGFLQSRPFLNLDAWKAINGLYDRTEFLTYSASDPDAIFDTSVRPPLSVPTWFGTPAKARVSISHEEQKFAYVSPRQMIEDMRLMLGLSALFHASVSAMFKEVAMHYCRAAFSEYLNDLAGQIRAPSQVFGAPPPSRAQRKIPVERFAGRAHFHERYREAVRMAGQLIKEVESVLETDLTAQYVSESALLDLVRQYQLEALADSAKTASFTFTTYLIREIRQILQLPAALCKEYCTDSRSKQGDRRLFLHVCQLLALSVEGLGWMLTGLERFVDKKLESLKASRVDRDTSLGDLVYIYESVSSMNELSAKNRISKCYGADKDAAKYGPNEAYELIHCCGRAWFAGSLLEPPSSLMRGGAERAAGREIYRIVESKVADVCSDVFCVDAFTVK